MSDYFALPSGSQPQPHHNAHTSHLSSTFYSESNEGLMTSVPFDTFHQTYSDQNVTQGNNNIVTHSSSHITPYTDDIQLVYKHLVAARDEEAVRIQHLEQQMADLHHQLQSAQQTHLEKSRIVQTFYSMIGPRTWAYQDVGEQQYQAGPSTSAVRY